MLGDAFGLVLAADHEARDVLQEQQRDLALAGKLDEVRAFDRAFAEQHAVVGEDRHRHAPDMGEAADQRAAVLRLEFVEFGRIDDPRDHLVDVIGRADVVGDYGVKLFRRILRRARVEHGQAVAVRRGRGG